MGSIGGKTKQLTCIVCGDIFTGSLYASPATAKCQKCKKSHKKVVAKTGGTTPAQVIHTVPVEVPSQIAQIKNPTKIILNRNRSLVEGTILYDTGEFNERIPAEWKPADNKLDYISISKISTYQQCPAKFHNEYLGPDPSVDNGNIFTWFGSIMHEVVDLARKLYYENGITANPLALLDNSWKSRQLTDFSMYKEARDLTLDYFHRHPVTETSDRCIVTELEWRGSIGKDSEGDDVIFGNQFDYIGEIDGSTGILKDYKTNRHPFTQYELEDSLQLQAYEIILRMIYPQYTKWITGYELFRFGWQQCPSRTQDDLDATKQFIINMWEQIKHDNTWEERLNVYCGYCKKRTSCKAYNDYLNDPQRHIDTILVDDADVASIERARDMINTFCKIADNRKDELSNIVKSAVEQSTLNGQPMVVDGKELYLQAQSRPSYNYYNVRDTMAIAGASNLLESCLSVNKTKLDKLTKSNPQLALQLTQCLEQGYSSPYLMRRKYKGK